MVVWIWIVIAIAIVLVLAAVAALAESKRRRVRTEHLRETFGPEYTRVVGDTEDRRYNPRQLESSRSHS